MKNLLMLVLLTGCAGMTQQEHSAVAKDFVDSAYVECQAYYREPPAKHKKVWDDICYGVVIAKEAE